MTDAQKAYLVGGILIAVVLADGAVIIFLDLKNDKKKRPSKEQLRAMEDELLNDEGEVLTFHAKVVDMACFVKSVGYQNHKQPKAVRFFILTFKKEDGTLLEVPVNEEMYGGFDVGLSGILTLVDGQLLSFEPEEG
jgi:hypothetical protein